MALFPHPNNRWNPDFGIGETPTWPSRQFWRRLWLNSVEGFDSRPHGQEQQTETEGQEQLEKQGQLVGMPRDQKQRAKNGPQQDSPTREARRGGNSPGFGPGQVYAGNSGTVARLKTLTFSELISSLGGYYQRRAPRPAGGRGKQIRVNPA